MYLLQSYYAVIETRESESEMKIMANGKEVELTGETILSCSQCRGYLWMDFKTGKLVCPKCYGAAILRAEGK